MSQSEAGSFPHFLASANEHAACGHLTTPDLNSHFANNGFLLYNLTKKNWSKMLFIAFKKFEKLIMMDKRMMKIIFCIHLLILIWILS